MTRILPGILFACLAFFVAEAQAVIQTRNWTTTIVGGPFNGTLGTGNFSWQDTALNASGDGDLSPIAGDGQVEVNMTILGQSFDETDDVDFNLFPTLTVDNFVPVFMNYWIREDDGMNLTPINQPNVSQIFLVGPLTLAAGGGFQSTGSIVTIPEPASAAMLLLAATAFAARSRRRNSR